MDELARSYKGLVRNAWKLFSLSHRAWSEPMSAAGLSSSTFPLLEAVVHSPGISQQEIADELSVDKSNASRGCRFLETEGLIRREKSLRVAHGFLCYPTEKGARVYRDVIAMEQDKIHEMMTGEDAQAILRAGEQLAELVRLLEKK